MSTSWFNRDATISVACRTFFRGFLFRVRRSRGHHLLRCGLATRPTRPAPPAHPALPAPPAHPALPAPPPRAPPPSRPPLPAPPAHPALPAPPRPVIRLLAIDIDGTLLDSRGRLPEDHRGALIEAAAAGVEVALVTGRSFHFTGAVLDRLP